MIQHCKCCSIKLIDRNHYKDTDCHCKKCANAIVRGLSRRYPSILRELSNVYQKWIMRNFKDNDII